MRCHNLLITITLLDFLQEILQAQTELCALRQPHWQALTHEVREHEEFHFLANFAVVTALGLLYHLQIFIEHLLLGEGDAVHTSHHRTLFVTTPICRTYRCYLDGLDRRSAHQVRATAKVGIITLCVSCDMTIFEFFNQLVFVGLATVGKELQCVGL